MTCARAHLYLARTAAAADDNVEATRLALFGQCPGRCTAAQLPQTLSYRSASQANKSHTGGAYVFQRTNLGSCSTVCCSTLQMTLLAKSSYAPACLYLLFPSSSDWHPQPWTSHIPEPKQLFRGIRKRKTTFRTHCCTLQRFGSCRRKCTSNVNFQAKSLHQQDNSDHD